MGRKNENMRRNQSKIEIRDILFPRTGPERGQVLRFWPISLVLFNIFPASKKRSSSQSEDWKDRFGLNSRVQMDPDGSNKSSTGSKYGPDGPDVVQMSPTRVQLHPDGSKAVQVSSNGVKMGLTGSMLSLNASNRVEIGLARVQLDPNGSDKSLTGSR